MGDLFKTAAVPAVVPSEVSTKAQGNVGTDQAYFENEVLLMGGEFNGKAYGSNFIVPGVEGVDYPTGIIASEPTPDFNYEFSDDLVDSTGNSTITESVGFSYVDTDTGRGIQFTGEGTSGIISDYTVTYPYTVTSVVKLDSGTASSPDFVCSGTLELNGIWLQDGKVIAAGNTGQVDSSTSAISEGTITEGVFFHIAAIFTSQIESPTLYIDAVSQTPAIFNDYWGCTGDSKVIGARNTAHLDSLNGSLDRFSVFNKALSQEEITADKNRS